MLASGYRTGFSEALDLAVDREALDSRMNRDCCVYKIYLNPFPRSGGTAFDP